MRAPLTFLLLLATAVFTPVDGRGQAFDISGSASVIDWPANRPTPEGIDEPPPLEYSKYNLLPFIKELEVFYQFTGDRDGEAAPDMYFELQWWAGSGGIVEGKRVRSRRMPDGIVIESIELLMDVIVDDEAVAEFFLPMDLIDLGPSPYVTTLEIPGGAWDSVFVDKSADETLQIFNGGFRLSPPRILRIVFASGRDELGSRTVLIPDADFWFAFHDRPGNSYRRAGPVSRRESGGRRRGSSSDSDDDDDDDDDDRFYPAAIAGVAAIGVVAVAGGTVGYYGSTADAPIGLMSGFVRPRGGALLHVAINKQVFGKASGPENLIAGLTAFYDVFGAPVQPALGFGIRATEEGVSGYTTRASVSLGVVGNFGPLVILADYDLVTPDFRIGTAINFRYRRR